MTKKSTATEPEDLVLYHFTAKGCSGKAVRCRELVPEQLDAALTSAAKRLSPDSTFTELKRLESRIGAETMVVEVSRARIAPTETLEEKDKDGKVLSTTVIDHTLDPDVRWEAFDPDAWQLNTKDWNVLLSIYAAEYSVSQAEVDDIMGKARRVVAA